jgi:DNA polymerase I
MNELVKCHLNEEMFELLEQFNWALFALDTETNNQTRYNSIDFSIQDYRNGISICDGKNNVYFHNEEGHLQRFILFIKSKLRETSTLNQKKLVIGMHNAPFDAAILKKHGLNLHNYEWFDTYVAAHLIDERKNNGLKDLAKEYLDEDSPKYDYNMKKEDFCKYALHDSVYTYKLMFLFKNKLEAEGLVTLFRKIEMPFLRCVVEMNSNGFLVDQELYKELRIELEDYITNKEIEMLEFIGVKYQKQFNLTNDKVKITSKVDINSSLQIRKILFEDLKIDSVGFTATGKEKTGKDFFYVYKDKHPFVKMLWEYKTARKLLNGFIEPFESFIDVDGRIRSSFNDCGTRTGRLSSNSPNLQQLPNSKEGFPEVRKLFVSSPGKKLVVADYSGQELRVLAQVSMCEPMIKAFIEGADFHQATADKFGVDRKVAKQINFGIAYGKSAYGFSKDWGVTEEEAQAMLDKYFSEFPEIKRKIDETTKLIKEQGFIATMTGRRRRFDKNEQGYYPNNIFRQGFNHLIQGFSADMIRIACIKVYNQIIKHPEWKAKMLATIHDEIILECDEDHVPEVREMVKREMEGAVKFKMPIISEVNIGESYADAK